MESGEVLVFAVSGAYVPGNNGGRAGPARDPEDFMGSLSIWHWIVVIVVVLLLFGRGKISELMGDVAQGIKSFKKGMQEDETAAAPDAPVKTIDHQQPAAAGQPNADLKQHAQTERKFEGSTS
jgi:sec-independent protein translocase protein TatA